MLISRFLGRVLILDAASCLAMGAMLVAAGAPLSTLFGLTQTFVTGAGIALIPIGLFILWVGTRREVPAFLPYAIVAGNALWVAESLVTALYATTITPLGMAFVLAQAAAVAILAVLEAIAIARAGTSKMATAA